MTLAAGKKSCRDSNVHVYPLQFLMTSESPTQFVSIFQSIQASTEDDFSLVMCIDVLVFVHAHMHRKPFLGCRLNNLSTAFLLESQPFLGRQDHNYLLHASGYRIPLIVNFYKL